MDFSDEDQSNLIVEPISPLRRFGMKKAGAIGLVGGLLLLAPAVAHFGSRASVSSEAAAVQQKDMIQTVEPRNKCSPDDTDCRWTKCCQISGHKCYQKDFAYAGCKKSCTPGVDGWSCIEQANWWHMKQVETKPSNPNLYCYQVYQSIVGPEPQTKKNWQPDLIRTQLRFGAGIFACQQWDVFADTKMQLTPGPPAELFAIQVSDVEGEFKLLTRRDKPDHYVNTPLYYQVWQALQKSGKYASADWTVKVDPATVFLPQRLIGFLNGQPGVPSGGAYYENCKGVDSGYFGNIELTSKAAMTTFLANLKTCKLTLCWQGKVDCENWKYGPWGEDKFMQSCMDKYEVPKVTSWDLTTSGTCPDNRPKAQKKNKTYVPPCDSTMTPAIHPFRTPTDYFACLGTIFHKDYPTMAPTA